jgi:hypothetical protein
LGDDDTSNLFEERIESAFIVENDQVPTIDNQLLRLQRITADTFASLALNDSDAHDLVLLFSGGRWHGPSHAILHILHSVAVYFSTQKDRIKFAM